MGLVILILLIEAVALLTLRQLRPGTLKRFPIREENERALAFILAVVLFTSLTFLFVFLGLGFISYFPLAAAEWLWMIVTAILILTGTAGVLLLRGRRQSAVATSCLAIGMASLLFWTIGRFI